MPASFRWLGARLDARISAAFSLRLLHCTSACLRGNRVAAAGDGKDAVAGVPCRRRRNMAFLMLVAPTRRRARGWPPCSSLFCPLRILASFVRDGRCSRLFSAAFGLHDGEGCAIRLCGMMRLAFAGSSRALCGRRLRLRRSQPPSFTAPLRALNPGCSHRRDSRKRSRAGALATRNPKPPSRQCTQRDGSRPYAAPDEASELGSFPRTSSEEARRRPGAVATSARPSAVKPTE